MSAALVKPWMNRRARILNGLCVVIQRDRAHGMKASKAYRKAQGRWNRSVLARQRGRLLTESAIRAIFAVWKKNPRPEAFAPKWGQPLREKITAGQAVKLAQRAVASRISVGTLYRQLRAETPGLKFSLRTLYRALPGVPAITGVWRARQALDRAERAALAILEKAAKDKYDVERANIEAQRKALEASTDNPALNEDQKAQLKAQIDNLDARLSQLQLDNASVLNLSDAQKIGLGAEIQAENQKASYVVQGQADKDLANQTKTDEKQAGSDAEAAIKSLAPSKQQAQEAHAAVQELHQGNAAGAAQLEEILSQLVGSAKGLTQTQADMFEKIMRKLAEVDQELSDHKSQIFNLYHLPLR